MYILKELWMQTSFFVRERLKLMNFKSTVSFNLQKVFLKVTKDHNDPERRLLQSHSTDSRWFLSARLRRISSWNNWRKVALFKQASVGLIYIIMKMLGYRGLTLPLPLQLSHLQNLSNHQRLPDIMQSMQHLSSQVQPRGNLAELLMILHLSTGNQNSEKKRVNHFQEEKSKLKEEGINTLPPRSSLEDTRRGELFPGSIFNDSL